MAVFVWHTDSKTLTLVKEFAPGREAVAHGVVAGMYEKDKHDSPLQAAKYEVSEGSVRSNRNLLPTTTATCSLQNLPLVLLLPETRSSAFSGRDLDPSLDTFLLLMMQT